MFKQCTCGSGKPFETCCLPLLNGTSVAQSPEQLMRSRYSAFALGGYGDYLLSTWSPTSLMAQPSLSREELSIKNINWQSLDVMSASQDGDNGYVEFKATFLNSQNIIDVHHEKSRFVRAAGRWFYLDGDVT